MAKTLLNCVNEVLKKVRKVHSGSELTTLSDSGRQVYIDSTIQAWNEMNDELYRVSRRALPLELAESTITLVTSDRDYALQSDLVKIRFPLRDETNGRIIEEYPGGYEAMVRSQLVPANHTGLASYAALRETDGELYLDAIPTSSENGLVYKYLYDKDIGMSVAADTVPYSDQVFRAMVPAVAEVYRRANDHEFDQEFYYKSLARASTLLTGTHPSGSYMQRGKARSVTDPYAS